MKSYFNFSIHTSFVFYTFGIAFILSYLFEGPPYNFFRLEASIGRSLGLHLSQRSRILCAFVRNYENSHLKKKKGNSHLATNPQSESHSSQAPSLFLPWKSPAKTPRQWSVITDPGGGFKFPYGTRHLNRILDLAEDTTNF